MIKEKLHDLMKSKLSGCGYKTRRNNWHRCRDAVHIVINLQKSQFVRGYYVNIGISILTLDPDIWLAEMRCPVRFTIERILELREAAELLDEPPEVAREIDAWLDQVDRELVTPLISSLDEVRDISSLREYLNRRVTDHIFLHHSVKTLLVAE